MYILVIIGILFFIYVIVFPSKKKEDEKVENNIDLTMYEKNDYVMTQTELKFYRELKKVTDKLELTIFPQVDLERFIKVKDNNNKDRNRIKSRSIDFTIVNNKNCKIICCIELDDYTHNLENVKKADEFKNNLFDKVGLKLHRIKVKEKYNIEDIEKIIKESI